MSRRAALPGLLLAVIAAVVVIARPYLSKEKPADHRAPDPAARVERAPPNPDFGAPANAGRTTEAPRRAESAISRPKVAFRSQRQLDEHFDKHARDTGAASVDDYLRRAQALRDAPLAPPVQELRRADGVVTRFDPRTGYFIAFNSDFTIRTFFRPADGAAYFRRQAERDN
ncbi:MAG TPA: hypothetical protein VEA69_07320 [Tepidisphaeraceae bacterium]|nr:hypothetical protein [Tepidisphaeraceae bacterium]